MTEPPEVRAERLRVVLALCAGIPYLDPRENAAQGLPAPSPAELLLMEDATEDDLALANACLEIEQELRQQAYAAVERLLTRAAGGSGELYERIKALPDSECARSILDLYKLGWVSEAGSGP